MVSRCKEKNHDLESLSFQYQGKGDSLSKMNIKRYNELIKAEVAINKSTCGAAYRDELELERL